METKICSKCKIEKPLSEFSRNKNKKGGVGSWCAFCAKQYNSNYYKTNKHKFVEYNKNYYQNNKEELLEYHKQYRKNNKKQIQNWKLKNKKKIARQAKTYHENHKKHLLKCMFKYKNSLAKFDTYAHQINYAEEVNRDQNGYLLVLCVYCGKPYIPTVSEVLSRLSSLSGKGSGECRFYCSEACKQSCSTYRQRKYWKGQKQKRLGTSREVGVWFRQYVLKEDNWTCQKCFKSKDEYPELVLHVHHIQGVAQESMLQNDIDNAITLCIDCHKEVHKNKGCTYFDYRRPECKPMV